MDDLYLIWNTEHRLWRKPGLEGYTRGLDDAGRYSRQEAMQMCTNAMPGAVDRLGLLPELPVRLADVNAFTAVYGATFGQLVDPWE